MNIRNTKKTLKTLLVFHTPCSLCKTSRPFGFRKNKVAKNYILHLPVKTGAKTELVNVDQILYFQAEGSYVQAVTDNKTFLITEPIYELESTLDPEKFARIHRSVIVQICMIKSIQSLLNGDHILLLRNGSDIRTSRTYKEKIKEL